MATASTHNDVREDSFGLREGKSGSQGQQNKDEALKHVLLPAPDGIQSSLPLSSGVQRTLYTPTSNLQFLHSTEEQESERSKRSNYSSPRLCSCVAL